MDRERCAVLLPGAKDFHCHVEEKDTAHVPLVHPLHHCCSNSQTGDSSFPMIIGYNEYIDGFVDPLWVGKCTGRGQGMQVVHKSRWGQGNKVIQQDKDTFSLGGGGEAS